MWLSTWETIYDAKYWLIGEKWGGGMWGKNTNLPEPPPCSLDVYLFAPLQIRLGKKKPTSNWIFSWRTWNFLELQIWLLQITHAHLTSNLSIFWDFRCSNLKWPPYLPLTSNLEHFGGLQIWLPQIKLRSPPPNGTFHGEFRHCRDFAENWKDIVSLQYISLKLNIALMNPGISLVIG